MNRIATAALLMIGVTTSLTAQRGAPSDSARLQGAWNMIDGSASGTAMPPGMAAQMKRVAAGNEVTITMNGQLYFKATFALDPKTSPKSIDYQMTGGPTAGSTQLGIYEMKGDTVRFAFAAPKRARPTSFANVSGSEVTLSTWIRAKP